VADADSTYNHYYSDTIQARRQDKYKALMMKARQNATLEYSDPQGVKSSNVNTVLFNKEIAAAVERDMDIFAAEEALDSQHAIYKVCPHFSFTSRMSL
jgi:hypothetical protein